MVPRASVVALVLALLVTACAGDPADAGGRSTGLQGELVVQAAASLTDAFGEIGEAFVDANADVDVVFNFAGSQALATQIVDGAPADVFASASPTQMDAVAEQGLLAGAPAVFATNGLAIAVEAGNPFDIASLADLDDPDLVLVLAAPDVPAGAVAAQALDAAAVEVAPASLEVDVRAVLAKVQLGEADAGIVYTSDIATAGDAVEGVVLPPEEDLLVEYPIAALHESEAPELAEAFIAFVLSDEAQAILLAHAFGAV
jgi:molybdate transport system substrate-binding protein